MKLFILGLLIFTGCARTTFTTQQAGPKGDTGLSGSSGTSCTTIATNYGARINCTDGTSSDVFNGTNGLDGRDLTLKSGLVCSVYDVASVNRNNGLINIFANAVPKFTKIINLFDVGDSQAALGFPKFTAAEQLLIGTEDYALDCAGYINIPVSNMYNFRVLSDDNVRLAINSVTLINSDTLHAPTWDSAAPTLLYKGLNKINVLYFQGPLTQIALKLQISGPTSSGIPAYTDIPSNLLFNL
jgi:PA14 domain